MNAIIALAQTLWWLAISIGASPDAAWTPLAKPGTSKSFWVVAAARKPTSLGSSAARPSASLTASAASFATVQSLVPSGRIA